MNPCSPPPPPPPSTSTSTSPKKQRQGTKDSNDVLNPFKEGFDPMRALMSGADAVSSTFVHPIDVITFGKACALDNLSACASLETAPFRLLQRRQQASTKAVGRSEKPTPKPKPKCRRVRGVLQSLMDKESIGPLSTLSNAVVYRRRIRIVVRDRHCITGYIHARLIAFDKHFNLVLRDADMYSYQHDNQHDNQHHPPRRLDLTLLRGENIVLISFIEKSQ